MGNKPVVSIKCKGIDCSIEIESIGDINLIEQLLEKVTKELGYLKTASGTNVEVDSGPDTIRIERKDLEPVVCSPDNPVNLEYPPEGEIIIKHGD